MFVKSKQKEGPKILTFNGATLTLEKTNYVNNFTTFQKVDTDAKTPGLANFEAFRSSLDRDLEQIQSVEGSYFIIAFGPSGTGKTTMITHLLKYLKPLSLTIEVEQLYVRQGLQTSSMKTQTADKFESTKDGIVELFKLREPLPGNITHVYLNEVEMIHKVGKQFYTYLTELKKLVEIDFNRQKFPTKGFMRLLNYQSFDNFADSYCRLIDETLRPEWKSNFDLFNRYGSDTLTPQESSILSNLDLLSTHFPEEERNKRMPPELKSVAKTCYDTLTTLRHKVQERYKKEVFFIRQEKSERENAMQEFGVSGGFIPMIWLQYFRDDNEVPKDTSDTNLDKFYQVYLDGGVTTQKNGTNVMYKFQEPRLVKEVGINPLPDYCNELTSPYESLMRPLVRYLQPAKYDSETVPFVCRSTQDKVPLEGLEKAVKEFSFQRSTPQNTLSSRSATIYNLTLKDSGMTKVTLVDLPGNEDQIKDCDITVQTIRCTETRGIHVLLEQVKKGMLHKKEKKGGSSFSSPIMKGIFDPMFSATCKLSFLFFTADYVTSPNFVQNAVNALGFVQELDKTAGC